MKFLPPPIVSRADLEQRGYPTRLYDPSVGSMDLSGVAIKRSSKAAQRAAKEAVENASQGSGIRRGLNTQ